MKFKYVVLRSYIYDDRLIESVAVFDTNIAAEKYCNESNTTKTGSLDDDCWQYYFQQVQYMVGE